MVDDTSTSPTQVTIVCSARETRTKVPLAELAESVERHNQQQHDGEEIAEVDPALAAELADLVAEELGLL
jgi:hypothetical protein